MSRNFGKSEQIGNYEKKVQIHPSYECSLMHLPEDQNKSAIIKNEKILQIHSSPLEATENTYI